MEGRINIGFSFFACFKEHGMGTVVNGTLKSGGLLLEPTKDVSQQPKEYPKWKNGPMEIHSLTSRWCATLFGRIATTKLTTKLPKLLVLFFQNVVPLGMSPRRN